MIKLSELISTLNAAHGIDLSQAELHQLAMTELVDLMTSTRAPLAEPRDRAQPF